MDDAARLFLELSREYLELVPILTGSKLRLDGQLPDGVEGRTIRRMLVMSMSLGRKFLRDDEAVYPPKLLHRVVEERRGRLSPAMRKKVTGAGHNMAEIISGIHETGIQIVAGDNTTSSTWDYWDRAQNGRTLHADYGKWAQHGESGWGYAALHWAFAAKRVRFVVAQTRWYVTDLGSMGVLDLSGIDTTPGDEIEADYWAPDGSPVMPPA